MLLPFTPLNELSPPIPHVVLLRPHHLGLWILLKLSPMGKPPCYLGDAVEQGKEVGRKTDGIVDHSCVEIHIRV